MFLLCDGCLSSSFMKANGEGLDPCISILHLLNSAKRLNVTERKLGPENNAGGLFTAAYCQMATPAGGMGAHASQKHPPPQVLQDWIESRRFSPGQPQGTEHTVTPSRILNRDDKSFNHLEGFLYLKEENKESL